MGRESRPVLRHPARSMWAGEEGGKGGGGVGADLMQKRTTVIAGTEALTVTTA